MRMGPSGHQETELALVEAKKEFEAAVASGQIGYDVEHDRQITKASEIQDGGRVLLMRPITGG